MAQSQLDEQPFSRRGMQHTLAHLRSLIRQFDTVTLITRRRTGGLHGRPMAVAAVDDDVTVWLITSNSSPKVREVADDGRAMLTFQRAHQFAALNGNIELVHDRDKIWELWRESYRIWYEGKSDPDIVLLRFAPHDAEYWDSSGAKGIGYVFDAIKAYVSGEKITEQGNVTVDPDVNAKVDHFKNGSS